MIKEILEKEEQEKSESKAIVFDDEKNFCHLLKKIFQKNDFLVETTFNELDDRKKALQFQSTIIIMDITLLAVYGVDVCKNIHYDVTTKNIKNIAISRDFI